MKRSLYKRLTAIDDRIADMESMLGLPQRRNLLLRHSTLANNARVYTDTIIEPQPYITNVSPRLVGLQIGKVEVSITDFQCEISRSIPLDLLIRTDNQRVIAIIDPPVDIAGRVIYSHAATKTIDGGIPCRVLNVRDDDSTVWRCILQKEIDQK